jgi:hypothetical protein
MRKGIIFFILISLIAVLFSYFHFEPKIDELNDALLGKRFLLPATDEEINTWNIEHHKLEIEAKERELEYLKNNHEVPIDNEFPLDDHYLTYPSGYNPPQHTLKQQIQEMKNERNYLVSISLFISFICTFALWAIYLHKQWDNFWK